MQWDRYRSYSRMRTCLHTTNLLLELFREDNYEDIECTSDNRDLEEILKDLLDEAVNGEL